MLGSTEDGGVVVQTLTCRNGDRIVVNTYRAAERSWRANAVLDTLTSERYSNMAHKMLEMDFETFPQILLNFSCLCYIGLKIHHLEFYWDF